MNSVLQIDLRKLIPIIRLLLWLSLIFAFFWLLVNGGILSETSSINRLALSLSLLLTAFVYLLTTGDIKRCLWFFSLIALGLLSFFHSVNLSTELISALFSSNTASSPSSSITPGTPSGFVIFTFLISLATGVVWTSIKDSEKRVKEQIDELIKQKDKLIEKTAELEGLENKTRDTLSNYEALANVVKILELKSKCHTYFFQQLLDCPVEQKNYLEQYVNFFRVDVNDLSILIQFLEIFSTTPNCPLVQNRDACHYLECLRSYYEQKKEESDDRLKLLWLCGQIH